MKPQQSEADAAYTHAVEVCNRLIRELEAQLPKDYTPRRKACDQVEGMADTSTGRIHSP